MTDKREFTLEEMRGFFKHAKEQQRIEEEEKRIHPLTPWANYLVALRQLNMRYRDIYEMLIQTGVLGKNGQIGKRVVKDEQALQRVMHKWRAEKQFNEVTARQIANDIASSPEIRELATSPMSLIKEVARITRNTPGTDEIIRIKEFYSKNAHMTLTDMAQAYVNTTLNGAK